MKCSVHKLLAALTVLSLVTLLHSTGQAADRLVVSSGHQSGWDALVINFGVRKGFFQAKGLDVQIVDMDTGAPTVQAVVSGSVDLAVGVGIPGFMAAAMKGAPLKMISANFTGAGDFAWYVRSNSPIKSFKDITPDTTVAYSSSGSSAQMVSLALMKEAGVNGRPVATGNAPATLTQVMTGQIDIGYDGNGGMGIAEFEHGDVRIIATGDDVPALRQQSVRGIVVTRETFAARRDQLVRFLDAYQQTIEWMYQDPAAFQWFADHAGTSLDEARRVVGLIYPKRALQLGPLQHLDRTITLAVEFKRIPGPPTDAQISDMFDNILVPATN
jgi:NitT/TauT family transport system substrate-binding protein